MIKLLSEHRAVLCCVALLAVVLGYIYIDMQRVCYRALLHLFYFSCDMFELLIELIELY